MIDGELTSLYDEIENFLHAAVITPATPKTEGAFAFWNTKTILTHAEIGMLCRLTSGPLCLSELAQHLGRDVHETKALLEALVAIGILDHAGDQYANTQATHMYCQALSHHWDK